MPRDLFDEERSVYRVTGPVIVTDDDEEWLPEYNCLGFALGVCSFLRWPVNVTGPDHLRGFGLHRRDAPSPSEKIIALFGQWPSYHVAKRLRAGVYESKCGDKLRIVHLLHDVERVYGALDSFWAVGEATNDIQAREAALLAEARPLNIDRLPPIEDAGSLIDDAAVALLEKLAATAKVDWWSRYRSLHPGEP